MPDVIEELFGRAYALEEQKQELYKERGGVRDALRNMRAAKMLTPEQEKELQELYPDVKRGDREEGDE
jgi:DNA-directed RNA polymerase sigma subunit (sigma70/sigma32)